MNLIRQKKVQKAEWTETYAFIDPCNSQRNIFHRTRMNKNAQKKNLIKRINFLNDVQLFQTAADANATRYGEAFWRC